MALMYFISLNIALSVLIFHIILDFAIDFLLFLHVYLLLVVVNLGNSKCILYALLSCSTYLFSLYVVGNLF